jgi:hypothetical protein
MTEAAFIQIHTTTNGTNINRRGHMHLNVNQDVDGNAVVSGVILHVDAYKNRDEGSTDVDEFLKDIDLVLQQAETIKFTFGTNNPLQPSTYELIITDSSYYSAPFPFFYFTIEPTIFGVYNNDYLYDPQLLTDVTITPYIPGLSFKFSDFNPLFNNTSSTRKSKFLMQSNRLESTTMPSNSASLYDQTAEKAFVQDTMYTDTGWSNARYVGSKSTPEDNAGIPPTISGRSFVGETFSEDTTTDYICKLDDRLQSEFFHDGNTQLPRYYYGAETIDENDDSVTVTPLTTLSTGGGLTLNSTVLNWNYSTPQSDTPVIKAGSLLKIITAGKTEYMRATTSSTTSNAEVTVLRGQRGTTPLVHLVNSNIYLVEEYTVYKLDSAGGSRLNAVGTTRIYVEGANSILESDSTGFIFSQSLCPVFNIDIEDGQSG